MAAHEETIYGLHTVHEAILAGESISRLIIGRQRQSDEQLRPLIAAAKTKNIPIVFEADKTFRALQGRNHQHVLALLEPFAYSPWAEIRARVRDASKSIVLALDHLEDPQNLGAVLRNAEGAGVDAVVLPERRSASLTAAVRRVAAGAASHLKITRVPNIAQAIEALKSDGCWVTGLGVAPQALPYWQADYTEKPVLVLGAEGKGLSRLVAERCDSLVRIPMLGQVASLNAASASAVVLFEVARRRHDPALSNKIVTARTSAKHRPNP